MELYQLKSFLAVAQTGSLSKAAVVRNISLSGISKHIKLLEESFNQPLFTRTVKGMTLTENGRQVLVFAERIVHDLERLQSLAGQAQPLRIGLNLSPDFVELSRLKSLLENEQHCETIFVNHNTGTLLNRLGQGELDLCLAFGDIADRFHKVFIDTVEMPLMIPLTQRNNPLQLERQCWIVNTPDCPFKKPLEQFWQKQAIQPRETILAQDLSRRELVGQGLGIGFLEPQDCLLLTKQGLAHKHDSFLLEINLWVVFVDDRFRPSAKFLRDYIRIRYEKFDDSTLNSTALKDS